jgi:hypothetical protein
MTPAANPNLCCFATATTAELLLVCATCAAAGIAAAAVPTLTEETDIG